MLIHNKISDKVRTVKLGLYESSIPIDLMLKQKITVELETPVNNAVYRETKALLHEELREEYEQ